MAHAVESAIIDLTGEDEDDDSIARAHAAYQKACEAASQLSNHWESLKSPKPIVHQNPKENPDLTRRSSLSTTVPKAKVLPRLGTFPQTSRSKTQEPRKDEKKNAINRRNSSVPSSDISATQPALWTAASKPRGSPTMLERTGVKKQQPRETTSIAQRTDTSAIRTPRSAAISAKQNIAEAYSELEEWVNKDPDLRLQQADIGTPRRLRRPNDDLDEWSPNSDANSKEEERKVLGRMTTNSPTPLAGKHDKLAASRDSSSLYTQGMMTSQGTKKRKLSESSQSRGSPGKVARWNEGLGAHREPTPPNSAEPASKEHVHSITCINSPVGISPRCVYPAMKAANSAEDSSKGVTTLFFENDSKTSSIERNASSEGIIKTIKGPPLEPPKAHSGENGVLTKSIVLHTQEKIDPRLQRGFREASGPTVSEPGPYSASPVDAKYAALFDSVVYPAIKKSKKRHVDSISWEELDAIGKIIVNEVIERLASHPDDPHQLNEDTKKKITRFVKKFFRRRVRKANTQSSQNSATRANDSEHNNASLPLGSSSLGGVTEGHRPETPGLDHSENVSLNWATVANEKEETQAPQLPHPEPQDQQLSSSLPHSPNESPASLFSPDFDRGRYPAQRRRRGNKYYTPTRPSKTMFKFGQSHSIPSIDRTLTASATNQRTNESGLSNGKAQLRLLKALANQPTTLPARAMHPTALTTDAAIKGTLTHDGLASELASIKEPRYMEHITSEPDSHADVAKAQREISAQGSQVAQRIQGNRLLGDVSRPKELRPSLRIKPATALDPSLEYLVAVLVTDTSTGPSHSGQRHSVTPKNQVQLLTDQSIVKYVDITSKSGQPKLVRVETKVIDPVRRPGRCIPSLLRNRELGLTTRGRHVGTVDELRRLKTERIEPWKNWKGASGDVVAVAWHPDSNLYAFGATALTNIEDLQYNLPCNLLLGNLTSNQVIELPDHRIDRPKPETMPNGPSANRAVYAACDPKVYKTVSSIAFLPTGDRMLTASHDCTVKIWDVAAGKHECLNTLHHEAWVTSIEVSEHRQGLFATASDCVKDAVRIYHDPSCYVNFSAPRAALRPEWKIHPECLRWGPNPYYSHLLLAGFQQLKQQGDLLSGKGELCLWDAYTFESIKVTPSSQSVYAAAWHPTQPFFATGGAPGNNLINKISTKTVVRTWDVRTAKRYQVEYECPATDMQDVTFSPLNSNIVTAGCTDGSSYVWDWRWPEQVLHRLRHGIPLAELDHTKEQEEADTGVMLSLWGPGGSLFYTGSSDGIVKAWDVRRHPDDVLIRNVANFDVGIQSGAFSPDGHNLLVGDAEGGIHILSSAPCGPHSNVKSTDAYIDLARASNGSGAKLDQDDDNPGTEGIEAAKSLVESGQLEYHKDFGVGQGLNYRGPYATYARKEADESGIGRLRKRFEKRQPVSKRGEKRSDIAIPMTSLLCERRQTRDCEKDRDETAPDGLKPKAFRRLKDGGNPRTSPSSSTSEGADEGAGATVAGGDEDQRVVYNTISEDEMVEENYWWVKMGEEEIEQARTGRIKY